MNKVCCSAFKQQVIVGALCLMGALSVTAEKKPLRPPRQARDGQASASAKVTADGQGRPNVLFILTDDQRWNCLGLADNSVMNMPNIDRLGRDAERGGTSASQDRGRHGGDRAVYSRAGAVASRLQRDDIAMRRCSTSSLTYLCTNDMSMCMRTTVRLDDDLGDLIVGQPASFFDGGQFKEQGAVAVVKTGCASQGAPSKCDDLVDGIAQLLAEVDIAADENDDGRQ